MAVDRRARCVVACLGEQADGYEGDALLPILDRARFACPELASVAADSGFAAERVWRGVQRRSKEDEATTEAQREAMAARARCKSERGLWAHKRRMADAEGVIGELKNRHRLDRVRSRGTPLFHVQLLLGCTALNCKRLADHVPEAASGIAAAPRAARSELPAAAAEACGTARHRASPTDPGSDPVASALGASPRTWGYVVCLN